MAEVVLLTGSNLGDKARSLEAAEKGIANTVGRIIRKSAVHESEPWGFESDDRFLNQVLVVETELTPLEVLDRTQRIETDLGRVRPADPAKSSEAARRYESRGIDIDILFYDNLILESERLTLPHPLIADREFVLAPLRETMPGFIHPVHGKQIIDL